MPGTDPAEAVAVGVRRAARPAAPARAARPRPRRRPDRPDRRAARRPAGGDHRRRLAARRAAGPRPGRARRVPARDLDALEEAADGYAAALKVQVCGPWTLAATHRADPQPGPGAGRPGRGGRPDRVAGRGRRRARRRGPQAGARRDRAAPAGRARAARRAGRRGAHGQRAEPGRARSMPPIAVGRLRAVLPRPKAFGIVHCCAADPVSGHRGSRGRRGRLRPGPAAARTTRTGWPRRWRRAWACWPARCTTAAETGPPAASAGPARHGGRGHRAVAPDRAADGRGWPGRWSSPRPAGWPASRRPARGPRWPLPRGRRGSCPS